MKLRITHIPPIRASLNIAGVCAVLFLTIDIVLTIYGVLRGNTSLSPMTLFTKILLVAGAYLAAIYVIALLCCMIYNIIAKRTGGLEFVVEEK